MSLKAMRRLVPFIACSTVVLSVGCNDFKLSSSSSGGESPETPGEYAYYEDGKYLGEGVNLDGVVWAPVNCGYKAAAPKGLCVPYETAAGLCPEGWRLPMKMEAVSLARNGSGILTNRGLDGEWFTDHREWPSDATSPSGDVPAIFLPVSGYQTSDNGSVTDPLNGYYWTNTDQCYMYVPNRNQSLNVNAINGSGRMMHVRCVHNSSSLAVPDISVNSSYLTNHLAAKVMWPVSVLYSGEPASVRESGLLGVSSDVSWIYSLDLNSKGYLSFWIRENTDIDPVRIGHVTVVHNFGTQFTITVKQSNNVSNPL